MKKLILVVMIFIIIFMVTKKAENTLLVSSFSSETNSLVYQQILVTIDNLNANNFKEYFSDMKVLVIYPYINPVYKDKISMSYVYQNIEKFKKYYINELESFGYYIEANKYLSTPIKINSVLIYSNLEELRERYSDKVIEECQNSSFYCVKLE